MPRAASAGRPDGATTVLPVAGMTCAACEVRITRALRRVPGVRAATVSLRSGLARVEHDGSLARQTLEAAVTDAGYRVADHDRAWLTRDAGVWRDVLLAAAAVVAAAVALNASGLTALADRVGGLAGSGGLGLVVVLGVAAGLSTCMALVGGLVLGLSARHAELHPDSTRAARLRPHLVFNVGRVVGFGALGALLGALGSIVALEGPALGAVMVVVALVMAGVGLRLTHLSPRLSRATVSLPAGLATALRLDRPATGYSDARAAALGVGSFLLPCGFTQAVQVYAVSTGSPARAGLVMSLFALGTVPGLLGVGGVSASVSGAFATRFFRFAGVAVLVFAGITATGGLRVVAPGLLEDGAGRTSVVDVAFDGDVQVLSTTQHATGYEPAAQAVYLGHPVRWEIDSTAVSCAVLLAAPELGLPSVSLAPGLNTLEFTPTETGTLHYSCAMGMYSGTIEVVPGPQT